MRGKPASSEFKRILNKINLSGEETKPRDQKVREMILQTMEIDPYRPIPHFPPRQFPVKYLAGELAWYLRKERTLDHIQPFSKFWNHLVDENGEINSNYGNLLFGSQLRWVYDSLVADKDSRQAIAFLNQPKFQKKGNKDFVCTIYMNFFIRSNKLNVKVNMRSNDIFYGFTYDAPFFSFVLQHMYLWLKNTKYPELEIGKYYHYADNIHYYERHFDLADKILHQPMETPPLFMLEKSMFHIDENGEYEMSSEAKEFCDNVFDLANNENSTKEDFIKELSKFFLIQGL